MVSWNNGPLNANVKTELPEGDDLPLSVVGNQVRDSVPPAWPALPCALPKHPQTLSFNTVVMSSYLPGSQESA